MKKLLPIILFISQSSFSQTENDDYELCSLILSEIFKSGIAHKIDSILLIEKFENRFDLIAEIFDSETDSITSMDLSYLSANAVH